MTAYFSQAEHQLLTDAVSSDSDDSLVPLQDKLVQLHETIFPQLRTQNVGLHVHGKPFVRSQSVSSLKMGDVLAFHYLRNATQAQTVERLMGREEVVVSDGIDIRRHPVVELRITPEHFVIELILSPSAWWDQQNLVGKLSITRHKSAFYDLLRTLESPYRMGFWRGSHLSEMHLTAEQFQYARIVDEWLSTFEPGKDWFRVGIWYEPEELEEDTITDTVTNQIKLLHALYNHILWTSDNNFRNFYKAHGE